MKKPPRPFIAYTAAGRSFGVEASSLGKAINAAEAAKQSGEEILAVIDSICVPAPFLPAPFQTGDPVPPFFAILLWNQNYKPAEVPE